MRLCKASVMSPGMPSVYSRMVLPSYFVGHLVIQNEAGHMVSVSINDLAKSGYQQHIRLKISPMQKLLTCDIPGGDNHNKMSSSISTMLENN